MSTSPHPETTAERYARLVAGTIAPDRTENAIFAVSTTDLGSGRGDLYVALGLASALDRLGWGVGFLSPVEWGQVLPEETTVSIAMLEDFIPVLDHPGVIRLAWVRNWTSRWAALPYLRSFDGVLASSTPALDRMRAGFPGPTAVLPLAADIELFREGTQERDLMLSTTVNEWGATRDIHAAIEAIPEDVTLDWFGARTEQGTTHPRVRRHDFLSFFDLPTMYGRSRLVLDDLTESAKQFGSQNSRLYEALACGALPIVNDKNGLDELGLGAVPTYATPEELRELLLAYASDPERIGAEAAALKAVLLERHTYDQRARSLSDFLAEVRATRRSERPDEALERLLADERARRLSSEHHVRVCEGELDALRHEIAGRDAELEGVRAEYAAFADQRSVRYALKLRAALPGGRG